MHRRRRLGAALAAAVLLSPVGAASALQPRVQAPEAGLGIRLVDAPADRRDDPRAGIYVVDHLSPGTTITRRVEAINGTEAPLRAELYAGTAELAEGTFRPTDRGTPGDVVDWTTVEPAVVQLAPGGRATAQVTIAVPADATDGERYGVVWAELPPTGAGVQQVNRVGVRIYLSVGEGQEPSSDFVVDSLQAARDDAGRPVVTAEVRNTGGRALDMSGELALADGPGGTSAGPFPAELGTTLGPGATAPVRVELAEELPAGPWRATLTLRSGTLERAAEATITFPDGAGEQAAAVAAREVELDEDNPWVFAAGALIGLLALLLLLLALLRRRSRRREDDDDVDATPQPVGA